MTVKSRKKSAVNSVLFFFSILRIAFVTSLPSDGTTLSYASSASSSLTSSMTSPINSLSCETSSVSSVEQRGNPATLLLSYVKDSFVRMKDGSAELYTNHKKCNTIRSKQKKFLENAHSDMSEEERRKFKRYSFNSGGITFEEYSFLRKGKDDRGKLANIIVCMFFAPNFLPYAFLFFPDMLPSPFATQLNKFEPSTYTKADAISRERSHSVLQTMLNLERRSHVPPMISNINPFGKGKMKRTMSQLDKLGRAGGVFLGVDEATKTQGAELILNVLHDEIYTANKPTKDVSNLIVVPKVIMMGMSKALEASSSNSFLPGFVQRGKVLSRLKQIKDSDDFLVAQKVDLNSLSERILEEACNERLIGGPGRTNEEMIEGLSSWLDLAVNKPTKISSKTGLYYNENMCRFTLLCYNAVDGTRDERSASYFPRLLYQGQLLHEVSKRNGYTEDSASTSDIENSKDKKSMMLFFRQK